ncbi:MAG: hypothetical protein ACOYM0_01230 [Bacteroidales bacterium]
MNCHSQSEAFQVIRLFKNYVEHAGKIHRKGSQYHYRRAYRLDSLDKCKRHYQYFKHLDPAAACRVIPRLRKELYDILPIRDNNSYDSTLKRLEELLQLCETINNKTHEVREPSYQHSDQQSLV